MKSSKIIIIILLFSFTSCADLDTINPNRGDIERVLTNPDDFIGVVEGQFNLIWHATQDWQSITLATAADSHTSSWGNFDMRLMSSEPRVAINNSQNYRYAWVVEEWYETCYSIIGAVNDILRLMDADPDLIVEQNGTDVTLKTKAQAYYAQGMAYGILALVYDKGKFVDETIALEDAGNIGFIPYNKLMTKALEKLDKAIEIANQDDGFDVTAYNGITLSSDEFVLLIHTMQAKFMIYNSRTDVENTENDWSKILALARQGIISDFAPIGDGITWWDMTKYWGTEEVSTRVDYRVINAMDPTQPSRFPTDNSHPLPPASGDNRLTTDMEYLVDIPFRAERGLYYYSHYDYTRYDYHYPGATGPMPHTTLVENYLILAEALIRTGGSKADAANLINNTRVTRGGLTPVSASDTDPAFIQAIMHERYIELYATMGGIPFYDRRRSPDDDGSLKPYTGLQPLTFRHFPIPAKELNILGEPIYTFGGVD